VTPGSAQVIVAIFEIKISVPWGVFRLRSKILLAKITKEYVNLPLISSESGTII
jgi:hypothetical protein